MPAKPAGILAIGRSSFYRWRDAYQKHGEAGLKNAKSIPKNPANQTPTEIVEKVLYLRRKYHLGPIRIVWYLARYHGIKISDAGVYRILKRNGLNRLPRGTRMRKLHTKRYQKQVPGHHIQVDVKFLTFIGKSGEKVRRFQYTAIDDATRVRALKVYEKHTQANAINFIDHIIEKFPFRIREVRTDNGHEFQAKFHWHVEDLGIRHAYIKRGTPQLNGKVERSHRPISRSFISSSVTKVTSIWRQNSTNGNASTTSLDRTAHTTARPLTKLSETSYSSNASVPKVRLGYKCLPSVLMGPNRC